MRRPATELASPGGGFVPGRACGPCVAGCDAEKLNTKKEARSQKPGARMGTDLSFWLLASFCGSLPFHYSCRNAVDGLTLRTRRAGTALALAAASNRMS